MERLIADLVAKQKQATPPQLAQIIGGVAAAPFAGDTLEVDEPLWGSFWQFDVIAPGYRLPAVELALLRAVRLDGYWPEETTVEQYLTDLRQIIADPQAGVWTLNAVQQPCVIIAGESGQASSTTDRLLTVVWYCASTGCLHAGYRVPVGSFRLPDAVEQRAMKRLSRPDIHREKATKPPKWVQESVGARIESADYEESVSLASQLDTKILRIRAWMLD